MVSRHVGPSNVLECCEPHLLLPRFCGTLSWWKCRTASRQEPLGSAAGSLLAEKRGVTWGPLPF